MYNETLAHTAGFALSAVGMTGNEITAAIAAVAALINAAVLLARASLRAYRAIKGFFKGDVTADEMLDAVEDFAEEVQKNADSESDQP